MIAQVGGDGKWRGRVWEKLSTILQRKTGNFEPNYRRKSGSISAKVKRSFSDIEPQFQRHWRYQQPKPC